MKHDKTKIMSLLLEVHSDDGFEFMAALIWPMVDSVGSTVVTDILRNFPERNRQKETWLDYSIQNTNNDRDYFQETGM